MYRLYHVVLLCYIICLIVFLLVDMGKADQTKPDAHKRQRRYLSFRNSSKFFLRLNFKANMVRWNQIFAQALGFRMNWDEPPDTDRPYHRLYRRTVYSHLETLLDKNGMNGHHCVRRAICEAASMSEQRKTLYYKILKMVFRRQSSETDKWHQDVTKEECLLSVNLCPFSFLDVVPYTDI